ncbi:MAG: alanine:cation symporter family protein, partial [bacterium]|nr:alanine:cation symporter family protein [bacterium]
MQPAVWVRNLSPHPQRDRTHAIGDLLRAQPSARPDRRIRQLLPIDQVNDQAFQPIASFFSGIVMYTVPVGDVSHFQAHTTAVSGTVGVG